MVRHHRTCNNLLDIVVSNADVVVISGLVISIDFVVTFVVGEALKLKICMDKIVIELTHFLSVLIFNRKKKSERNERKGDD